MGILVRAISQLQRSPTLRCFSAMEVHMKNFYMYEEGFNLFTNTLYGST
jgi:hypothetical protein